MNKKALLIATVVAALSVSSAYATSNISGVTGVGGNDYSGTFTIDPAKSIKDVGYRQYDFFNLGEGDTANLNFLKDGARDIQTFVNLVKNKVNINGVMNSVRNNQFYDGHVVFITPGGMVVGESGVLNVGTLSVATPNMDKYNALKEEYDAGTFTAKEGLNDVSGLKKNHSGFAPVEIQGKVIAKNGIDIRASRVDITGGMLNGITLKANNGLIRTKADADSLFNSLVNTDGLGSSVGVNFVSNGSTILIKTADNGSDAGVNIGEGAKVANLSNGGLYVTNYGKTGLTNNGILVSKNGIQLLNQKGDMIVNGTLRNIAFDADIDITNKGNELSVGAKTYTNRNLNIVNKEEATGSFTISKDANLNAKKQINLVNKNGNGQGMYVKGKVGSDDTADVRIVNRTGMLNVDADVMAKNTVYIFNEGNSHGFDFDGSVYAGKHAHLKNASGDFNVNGKISVGDTEGAKLHIENDGDGALSIGELTDEEGNVIATVEGHNEVFIRNYGDNGMNISGKITNNGETTIQNFKGDLNITGSIENRGNMGIINQGQKFTLAENSSVSNTGKTKFVNTGNGGMEVAGNVTTNGETYFYNDNGHLTIKSTAKINNEGDMFILSRKTSTGITTERESLIANKAGKLAIKNTGSELESDSQVGMDLNGKIENTNTTGDTAINNYNGDMIVSGSIKTEGDLGIINRAANDPRLDGSGYRADDTSVPGGSNMRISADISGHNINIKNNGNGNMYFDGEIYHDGRLNIIVNEGKLTLSGHIFNEGTDMTYAVAKSNATGVETTSMFNAVSECGGDILIKNISGENGLTHNGTIIADTAQAAVVNKKGDMTVSGSLSGKNVIVSNNHSNGGLDLRGAKLEAELGTVNVANSGATKALTDDKTEVIVNGVDVTDDTKEWLHEDKNTK